MPTKQNFSRSLIRNDDFESYFDNTFNEKVADEGEKTFLNPAGGVNREA